MGYQHLPYAVDHRVATMLLERSERHNALSQLPAEEITEQFSLYE